MASDLSSGCNEAIGILDEKEEGEISLEDVSSSEEGHPGYDYGIRRTQCPRCLSTQHCATWCTASARSHSRRCSNRRDAVHGKENRHYTQESGSTGAKHTAFTLQEKNDDDLVSISSDSDMEIVGLADKSKQIVLKSVSKSRVKKKRKSGRIRDTALAIEDLVTPSSVDGTVTECANILKRESLSVKGSHLSRTHHRDPSPEHRSTRPRIDPRSPSRRYRSSPVRLRSPFKKSRSPVPHARSPILRKSPRRLRSPRRSPYRSPVRSVPRKVASVVTSPPHRPYVDMYADVNKLLKKVKHLDSIGVRSLETTINRNKENASSLKQKLVQMMKGMSDTNGNVADYLKTSSGPRAEEASRINDHQEDEDLALLRQKALETKQKRPTKHPEQQKRPTKRAEQPKSETEKKQDACNGDSHDDEDLELRMIALRSAIIKKHQNRVQRDRKSGVRKRSAAVRSESPFSQSFLDNIPIPDEARGAYASPPRNSNESLHTEDMELDTDVEREKERLPYSPTDNITASIAVDTELLGIQPSDVSFISVNEAGNAPAYGGPGAKDNQDALRANIIPNMSYLTTASYYGGAKVTCEFANANVPYSPSDPTGTPRRDLADSGRQNLAFPRGPPSLAGLPCDASSDAPIYGAAYASVDARSSQETPYSPTDTPMYEPDAPQAPSRSKNSSSFAATNKPPFASESRDDSDRDRPHRSGASSPYSNAQYCDKASRASEEKNFPSSECSSTRVNVGSAISSSPQGSISSSASLITIDDLPETDACSSPRADGAKDSQNSRGTPRDASCGTDSPTEEPLYMQAAYNVTKESNKIPTLINRTLVPMPILKSNKQLQQLLPVRRPEPRQEPSFKSAEMQPVTVDARPNATQNMSFKPIKLVSVSKKPQSMLTPPVGFDDGLNDEPPTDACERNDTPVTEERNHDATPRTDDAEDPLSAAKDSISAHKRKRRRSGKLRGADRADGEQRIGKDSATVEQANGSRENDALQANGPLVELRDGTVGARQQENRLTSASEGAAISITNSAEPASDARDAGASERDRKELQCKTVTSMDGGRAADGEHSSNSRKEPSADDHRQTDQGRRIESRRESVDDDEEALRAILLASMVKRSKPSDASTTSTVATAAVKVGSTPKQAEAPVSSSTSAGAIAADHAGVERSEPIARNAVTEPAPAGAADDLPSSTNPAKKRSLSAPRGQPKKIAKKVSIPASTKVVNNAKRYQNMIVQKKLHLQKIVNMYNVQRQPGGKYASTAKPNETKWSAASKPSNLPDAARFVINLGSDTDSESDAEQQRNDASRAARSGAQQMPVLAIPTSEFERSVDQFLRDVRKKQESAAATKPTLANPVAAKPSLANPVATKPTLANPVAAKPAAAKPAPAGPNAAKRTAGQVASASEPKTSSNGDTPAAVRHLPASRQEEYRRLKQQIEQLEREKLKLRRPADKGNAGQPVKQTASTDAPSAQLSAGANQSAIAKSQTQNTHSSSKENTTPVKHAGSQSSQDSADKSIVPNIAKNLPPMETSKTLKNLNIRVVNDTCLGISLNGAQRVVVEKPTSLPQSTPRSPGLKVLTRDEVNSKYEESKVEPKEQSKNNNIVKNNTKNGVNRLADGVAPEIRCNLDGWKAGVNESIDSDASTIILSRESENREGKDTSEVSESTLSLSQYQAQKDDQGTLTDKDEEDTLSLSRSSLLWDSKSAVEFKAELNTLLNLPQAEQKQHLMELEHKLVIKRYTVLEDLTDMSGNLRQWDVERDIQTQLVAEVKKLREQLKVAEEMLQRQRNRISSMGPKVLAAREKVNDGRRECSKLSRMCSALGGKIAGPDYKVPEAGESILISRLKEVANRSRQLSKKKVPSIDIPDICAQSTFAPKPLHAAVRAEAIQTEECLLSSQCTGEKSTVSPGRDEDCEQLSRTESSLIAKLTVVDSHDVIPLDEADGLTDSSSNNESTESATRQNDKAQSVKPLTSSTPKLRTDGPESAPLDRTVQSRRTMIESELCKKSFPPKKIAEPYVSILAHLKSSRSMDPNGILCPYDLMGTCCDADCQFLHQSNYVR